jgi:glycosyltransferase involved in cell wall biosynthesis
VIHNGVSKHFKPLSPAELTMPAGVPDAPYVLGVGARIPRKNFVRLIQAHGELAKRGLPHHLVIAGPPGQSQPEIERAIDDAGTRAKVHVVGYPTDAELTSLYNRAALFVYPSIYEGFGIPVLEAMACGAPVVCSNTSSVPEVAGDAAVLADPTSVPALAEACHRVLTDPALESRLRAAGPARAAQFSWDEAARKTAALVRELA